jgi:hypothetical protein
MTALAPSKQVTVTTACESCHRGVLLECEGRPAYQGYQTFNEYICPHCRKKNVQLTPGLIVRVKETT